MEGKRVQRKFSEAEYLLIERQAEYKSEFLEGEIYAMSGASFTHNAINSNLLLAFGTFLRGKTCRPLSGDMRVQIPGKRFYTYPDFLVVCGKREFVPDGQLDTLLNPSIIIEIQSKSTQDYDRGLKFKLYQNIESLQEYALISTENFQLDLFLRTEKGAWEFKSFDDLNDQAYFPSIGFSLPLKEVYEEIELN